jgi:hypothetical protein
MPDAGERAHLLQEGYDMNDDTIPMAGALRVVADLIDAHPDLPLPCVWGYGSTGNVEVQWQLTHGEHKDEQRAMARVILRAIGGEWKKDASTELFSFDQRRDGLNLNVIAARDQICERVVTGTETVTIPAVEAQPERTEEREVVEWRCEPVMAEVTP